MEIIEILIPVFLVFGLGALSVALKIFKSTDSYIFTRYVFYFGFPILIFNRLNHTAFEKVADLPFLLTNILNLSAVVLLILAISWLFKCKRKFIGMLVVAGIFGNVAYMGLPMSELMFGSEGVGYASIIVGLVVVFSLSVGISFLEYFSSSKPSVKTVAWSIAKNPIVIGIVLGLIASAVKLEMPTPIENFLVIVAKSAGPVALFAIGMFLVGGKIAKDKKKIAILCLVNLLALPFVTFGIGTYLGLSGMILKVSILQSAMPLAATNFVLAQKYKIGEDIISSAIVVSTLLSIVTIGLVMWLF
ncbi:AEC family transporter [Candidatus Peregrinibacteria bacterium]|jgi:malonate transporter and related proteins|nr:AEC family transporter [Candidatus Peregrinibacteria bacterium]